MQNSLSDPYMFPGEVNDNEDSLAFSKFIRSKIKDYNEYNPSELTVEKLGEALGIDNEIFRKKLNKNKPINERDCIIAMGVVLCLSPGEIDEALALYDMLPLNPKDDRDRLIESLVSNAFMKNTYDLTVSLLDDYLRSCGFRTLKVQNKKNKDKSKKGKPKKKTLPYKIIDQYVSPTETAELYSGDIYDSLCTIYNPYSIRCFGEMLLGDSNGKPAFVISADTSNLLSYSEPDDLVPVKFFDSINNTGIFEPYFKRLYSMLNIQRQKRLDILKDTRNYRIRSSAKVKNDSLCIFVEEYNYTIPELNEYFVVSRTGGIYEFCVYEESAFMKYYLSSEEYKNVYYRDPAEAKEKYDSVEQIEALINSIDKHSVEYYRLHLRSRVFRNLISIVDELFNKIEEEKVYIQNPYQIYGDDYEYEIIGYYHLDNDFVYENIETEYEKIVNYYENRDYIFDNGQTINISHKDLLEAFKLGIKTLNDILRIKSKYGSIKSIIR